MAVKLKTILLVTLCAILFSSCSVRKKSWRSEDKAVVVVTEDKQSNNRSAPRRREAAKQETARRPRVDRPTMYFSETETAHVRIPQVINNPFPASGEMEVDLAELSKEFYYPLQGNLISPYGMRGRSMHTGIDIKGAEGDTIRAALPGVVRMSKLYSSYGNIVVLRHYNGLETVYSHNIKNLVAVNDVVEPGDPIALVGRTGRATTEHLHFEIRIASEPMNPILFVDTDKRRLREGKVYMRNNAGTVFASNSHADNYVKIAEEKPKVEVNVVPKEVVEASAAKYHTIKSGDTLSHLARTYSTTVSKICSLNGIQSTKILQLGEKIRVK